MDCTIRLLDGKVFEKVLQYAREENPYLLILGRIGVHSAPDMDIGGNTENLLRLVPCNVYLSSKVFKPPDRHAGGREHRVDRRGERAAQEDPGDSCGPWRLPRSCATPWNAATA